MDADQGMGRGKKRSTKRRRELEEEEHLVEYLSRGTDDAGEGGRGGEGKPERGGGVYFVITVVKGGVSVGSKGGALSTDPHRRPGDSRPGRAAVVWPGIPPPDC